MRAPAEPSPIHRWAHPPFDGGVAPRASTSTSVGSAALTVCYEIVSRKLLSYTVRVTVRNPAGTPRPWVNAATRLTGVDVAIGAVDPSVTFHAAPPDLCFAPVAAATVPPARAVSFTFTVTAIVSDLLGDVDEVALDQPG